MKKTPKPTKGELSILQALWALGPSTVRAVHEKLGQATGYTTILKLLQIMTEKGLVERHEEGRGHIYKARIAEKRATGDFVRDLVKNLFGGSSTKLVIEALNSQETSKEEIAAIRRLLDEKEGK